MKNARVIIGSGYGDEGKGLATDYFSQDWADLCVRFNGGGQAGHTVHREGISHVFSHFGSATLQGIPTYLGPRFVVNPWVFKKEHEELLSKGIKPEVYVHPECYITHLPDVLLNRFIEEFRGKNRHGSVGVGFNETITRCYDQEMPSKDINYIDSLGDVVFNYFYQRLIDLGMPDITARDHFNSLKRNYNHIFQETCKVFEYFRNNTRLMYLSGLKEYDNVIFEGAQGLKLDEFEGQFPYVTRSRTGLGNVKRIFDLIWESERVNVDVHYITRSYTTRHGAGPLENEEDLPEWVVDSTNRPNAFQGSLRYAPIENIEDVFGGVIKDFMGYVQLHWNMDFLVTCQDQYNNRKLVHSLRDVGFKVYESYSKFTPKIGEMMVGG